MGYTKGPWKLDMEGGHTPGCGDHASIISADGSVIADGNWYSSLTHEEDDLRLIAAAPDLLEALEHCADVMSDPWKHGDLSVSRAIARALAAIARAKGEAE